MRTLPWLSPNIHEQKLILPVGGHKGILFCFFAETNNMESIANMSVYLYDWPYPEWILLVVINHESHKTGQYYMVTILNGQSHHQNATKTQKKCEIKTVISRQCVWWNSIINYWHWCTHLLSFSSKLGISFSIFCGVRSFNTLGSVDKYTRQ